VLSPSDFIMLKKLSTKIHTRKSHAELAANSCHC